MSAATPPTSDSADDDDRALNDHADNGNYHLSTPFDCQMQAVTMQIATMHQTQVPIAMHLPNLISISALFIPITPFLVSGRIRLPNPYLPSTPCIIS